MEEQEVRDKVRQVYNRCLIIDYILTMPAPIPIKKAIVTLLEDSFEDMQSVIDGHCIEGG